MKELVSLGHEVFCITHPKSQLETIGVKAIFWDRTKKREQDFRHLIPKEMDLIHLFYNPAQKMPLPHLITIEGNGNIGETFDRKTVFISKKHAENHGATNFVYNGLDLTEYPALFRKGKGEGPAHKESWDSFAFLAKAKWSVKNLRSCVRGCRSQKKHLHICGGRWPLPSRYLHSHGMVDDRKKREVLGQSDALLFPVRWHEPFGIAVIEAMALGLPVIGSPYGSLPELISTKEVGALVKNEDELKAHLKERPYPFDKEAIRAHVEEHFSSKLMAKRYIELYKNILKGEDLQKDIPIWKPQKASESLLPF